MLGRDVVARRARRSGTTSIALAHDDLDITDAEAVERRVIAEQRPDAVVNCAAWTDVDGAEDARGGGDRRSTATGARQRRRGRGRGRARRRLSLDRLRLRRHARARPTSSPTSRPALRLRALEARRRAGDDRGTTRATSSCAPPGCSASHGRNFVDTMLRLGERPATRSWSCATRSAARPTPATSPRGSCGCSTSEDYGIHHMAGGGHCSWYEFAVEIFQPGGRRLPRCCRRRATCSTGPAPRPAYSVLVSEREHPIVLPRLAARASATTWPSARRLGARA